MRQLYTHFLEKLIRLFPGLSGLVSYRKEYLSYDIRAGLSVAAVSLPVSIAYSELTGVGAIAGLYSTILPLIAYAFFGSSKQLIIGPDTATCAVVAAVVIPITANNPILRWQLVIVITIMIGLWCIFASKLKLGALSDLLSRPILIGLLNGISITIFLDQIAKMGGFKYDNISFIERLISLPFKIISAHIPTILVSTLSLIILILLKKYKPRWSAPLIVVIFMALLSWLMNFEQYGIKIIKEVSNEIIPFSSWANFDVGLMPHLVVPSLNIAVICFISMMITVRSFAAKNNYDTDADTEFKALGIANIVAGLSNGFVVSGTSSRTAVNDVSGGKTQLVSIIAALIIAIVVFFFLSPLQYIPTSVLGVILIYSSWSLIDITSIIRFFKLNRDAFYLSFVTLISVLVIGIIPGMALAVLLGLFLFLRKVFRPTDQLLGEDKDGRIHALNKNVLPINNTIIYRFNSPLTYFNIAYFKKRLINLVDKSEFQIDHVIIDTIPCFIYQDISVLLGIDELVKTLKARNVKLILAGRRKTLKRWFKDMNIEIDKESIELVYDLYFAVKLLKSQKNMKNE